MLHREQMNRDASVDYRVQVNLISNSNGHVKLKHVSILFFSNFVSYKEKKILVVKFLPLSNLICFFIDEDCYFFTKYHSSSGGIMEKGPVSSLRLGARLVA